MYILSVTKIKEVSIKPSEFIKSKCTVSCDQLTLRLKQEIKIMSSSHLTSIPILPEVTCVITITPLQEKKKTLSHMLHQLILP